MCVSERERKRENMFRLSFIEHSLSLFLSLARSLTLGSSDTSNGALELHIQTILVVCSVSAECIRSLSCLSIYIS